MNIYTTEQRKTELYATGKDIETGEPVFEIETRPILYHEVSVWGSSGRRGQTITPICVCCDYGEDVATAKLRDGDTIIACVPATEGSYCVYAYASKNIDTNTPTEECLGAIIAGNRNTPDMFREEDWIIRGARYAELYHW